MIFAEVLAIAFLALALGAIFYFGFRRGGPWGSFWSFLVVLLLGMWAVDVWFVPFGPVAWGVAWLDLLLVGLVFALLLAAASPDRSRHTRTESGMAENKHPRHEDRTSGAVAIGSFFWILMLVFVVLIFMGYFF